MDKQPYIHIQLHESNQDDSINRNFMMNLIRLLVRLTSIMLFASGISMALCLPILHDRQMLLIAGVVSGFVNLLALIILILSDIISCMSK